MAQKASARLLCAQPANQLARGEFPSGSKKAQLII